MIESERICYRAFRHGLQSVDSAQLVRKCIRIDGSNLHVGDCSYRVTGRLVVMAIGKASLGMLRALYDVLEEKIDLGICCLPEPMGNDTDGDYTQLMGTGENSFENNPKVKLFFGSRSNLPNEEVVKGSELAHKTALSLTSEDLLLVSLTGGGSALLTLPKTFRNARLSLDDLVRTTKLVSSTGAEIQQLNAVRSCLDELKAGGLALAAYPAQVVTVIISDVIGDPLQYIASGPTFIEPGVTNAKKAQRCVGILKQLEVWDKIPETIRAYLESELSTSDSEEVKHPRVTNLVIGNNMVALNAAAKSVETDDGINGDPAPKTQPPLVRHIVPLILTNEFSGNATENGRLLAELLWHTANYVLELLEYESKPNASVSTTNGKNYQKLQELLIQLEQIATTSKHNTVETSRVLQACTQVASALREAPKYSYGGIVFLLGGEATVIVSGDANANAPADGGRCSHLALSAAIRWYELMKAVPGLKARTTTSLDMGILAGASDGLDGPGACGGGTWVSAFQTVSTEKMYKDAKEELQRCNSYGFFRNHNPNVILPPRLTGTNVMDLLICAALVRKPQQLSESCLL